MDKETNYYFYNARHYDPEICRFVTADDRIDGEDTTQGWNRYAYVKNNPIIYKDPTGHSLRDGLQSLGEWMGKPGPIKNVLNSIGETAHNNPKTTLAVSLAAGVAIAAAPAVPALVGAYTNACRAVHIAVTAKTSAVKGAGIIGTGIEAGKYLLNKAKLAVGNTETVQRAMSNAELQATRNTGLLRGGRAGTHYVSDAVNSNMLRARQRLALPQTPDVGVTLEVPKGVFSSPTLAQPKYNMPGGGMERMGSGRVPVKIVE